MKPNKCIAAGLCLALIGFSLITASYAADKMGATHPNSTVNESEMKSKDGGAAPSVSQKKELPTKTDSPAPQVLMAGHEQMEAVDQNEREKFILQSITFLRDALPIWSQGKDDEDLRHFVKEMIYLAHRKSIHREINIQKLMHYRIQYAHDIPESDYPGDRLGGEDLDEYQKVERLYFTLTKNQNLIEISLE